LIPLLEGGFRVSIMPANSSTASIDPAAAALEARVLIVEDDADMRNLIRLYLRKLGIHQTLDAEDAAAALRLLKAEKVDLIISDLYMPHMNGIAFYKELHEDPRLENIPFLMITAEASRSKILEAMMLGIRNYIIKPIDPENLLAKVSRLLKLPPS